MTFLTRPSRTMKSFNVAIGAAGAFVALSALASLVAERDDDKAFRGAGWSLRGTITPADFVVPCRNGGRHDLGI